MTHAGFGIRPIRASDKAWVECTLNERWGSTRMVSRGVLRDIAAHEGFIATREGSGEQAHSGGGFGQVHCHARGFGHTHRLGHLRDSGRRVRDDAAAIAGGGHWRRRGAHARSADAAIAAGYGRLWLVTTNDNTRSLRFYQRRGFTVAAVHINALQQARKLKPGIPLTGADGIPLRDEIELEMRL